MQQLTAGSPAAALGGGVDAIALILILSFAIERVAASVMFLLSYKYAFAAPARVDDAGKRAIAERDHKLVYSLLAVTLGIGVLLASGGDFLVLRKLGIVPTPSPKLLSALDYLITVTVLLQGADAMSKLQKTITPPKVEEPDPKPVEITGTLTLEKGWELPERP